MTSPITPDTTLGTIVAERSDAARILDRLGLDYCCHGERSLQEACETAGLEIAQVVSEIEALGAGSRDAWTELGPADLADHVVEQHHHYLRDEMPPLIALATKVRDVHGERHPELGRVAELVSELWAELEPHLDEEERILFPAIRALVDGGLQELPFGSVANPIRVMSTEHDGAGELLTALRHVTGGFDVPGDGCASYRSLYERLDELELDTHVHIHKENHALFPAALRLVEEARHEGDTVVPASA